MQDQNNNSAVGGVGLPSRPSFPRQTPTSPSNSPQQPIGPSGVSDSFPIQPLQPSHSDPNLPINSTTPTTMDDSQVLPVSPPNNFPDTNTFPNTSVQQSVPSVPLSQTTESTYIAPVDTVTPTVNDLGGEVPAFDPLQGVDGQQVVQDSPPSVNSPVPADTHNSLQSPQEVFPHEQVMQNTQSQGQMPQVQQTQQVPQSQVPVAPVVKKGFSFPKFSFPFGKKKS